MGKRLVAVLSVPLFLAVASAHANPKGGGAKAVPPPTKPSPHVMVERPDPSTVVAPEPHKEGDYGGVTPGQKPSGPGPKPKHLPSKGTLSWIGFEAKDGGAQVFLQAIAPFEVTQAVVGGTLFVYLPLPHLGQNTWRQVDTRFFDNPLAGIQARQVGAAKAAKDHPAHAAGIEVRVAFKNAKDAHEAAVRSATEADQMFYVYLTFPEGTAAPKPATPTPTTKDPEK